MAESVKHAPGSVSWVDLATPDLARAQAFYGALLGWTFESAGPEYGGYTLAKRDGRNVAGMMQTQPGDPRPPTWGTYFAVEDAAQVGPKVKALGGRTIMEPMEVGDRGRMAVFADSTGAEFGVWEPKDFPGAEAQGTPGTRVWSEVHSRDGKKSAEFYCRLFGLEPREIKGEGTSYWILDAQGGGRGGALTMDESWPPDAKPQWMTYFHLPEVAAAVRKVQELGGRLLVPSMDTPFGEWAVVADPLGAPFKVMKPKPPA